jgi:hypothetical protein
MHGKSPQIVLTEVEPILTSGISKQASGCCGSGSRRIRERAT